MAQDAGQIAFQQPSDQLAFSSAAKISAEQQPHDASTAENQPFDYSYVPNSALIAVYDSPKAAPRIEEIKPAPTTEFIENLASTTYHLAAEKGSQIPYTVIREVTENFIHAQFSEIVVSILSSGNTIRFADQGPGIAQKDKVQLPGYTSATKEMKPYIRGVGSGLPIVREFLQVSSGHITIDDNLVAGSVITISVADTATQPVKTANSRTAAAAMPPLSDRQKQILMLMYDEGDLGITDVKNLTGMPVSSISNIMGTLEQEGLIAKTIGKKRNLTDMGMHVAQSLH